MLEAIRERDGARERDLDLLRYELGEIEAAAPDPGEEAEAGALRELEEETDIPRDKVEIVAWAPEPLFYDLPDDLIGKVWKGKWRGQRQTWFLMRFLGEDKDVNIATPEPEFRAWKWAEPADLPAMIVPFKQQLYRDVLAAFAEWL